MSNSFQNNLLYKATTDYVIQASAYVTENQKGKVGQLMYVVCKYNNILQLCHDNFFKFIPVTSQLFDDKLNIFLTVFKHVWKSQALNQQEAVQFLAAMSLAAMDNYIGVWKQKHQFDAVRPFTAVRHVYKDRYIKGNRTEFCKSQ